MASQWAAIRNLREETELHHKKFRLLASRSHDPIMSELLAQYPDSRSIRTTGAQLVKDVLEDFQPQKLSHVFAFTSFSYSISMLLFKAGRMEYDEILADLKNWRDLIVDKKEKQVFNRLAPELWPESKNHLHFIDVPEHPLREPLVMSNPPAGTLAGPADPSAQQFLFPSSVQATVDPDYPFLLHSLGLDGTISTPANLRASASLTDRAVQQLNGVHKHFDLSALLDLDLLGDLSQSQQQPDTGWPHQCEPQTIGFSPGPHSFAPGDLNPPVAGRGGLQTSNKRPEGGLVETVTFLVVLHFLHEIAGLLNVLSGGTCLAPRRHKLYEAQKEEQATFYQHAMETFFRPFYQGPGSETPAFMALFSMAETLTKRGYIRSTAEIVHYLVTLAGVRTLFDKALLWPVCFTSQN